MQEAGLEVLANWEDVVREKDDIDRMDQRWIQ
jgi:hypothetical protein